MEKYKRPESLEARVTKYKMPCGSLYVITSLDSKGYPREIFLEGSKRGTCRANLEGEARLITKLLAEGMWEEAMDALDDIRCPACMRSIGKKMTEAKEEVHQHPWSCPDAMAREIKKVLEERKEKK